MIVAFVILAIYIVLIGSLFYGFQKMKPFTSDEVVPKMSFSIVVPFRNETENLPKLLHTLSFLDYPNELFEVILVDDESDDNYTITNYEFSISVIKNIRKSNSPKKDAIETAIEVAKHNWIITTDADCLVQKSWLKTIDAYIQKEEKRMAAAGVCYLPQNGFLHAFQNLDFLSLQGATIGSFGLNKPFMCNGANFTYEKKFFLELNGFEGNSNMASGDDVFLLQKAVLKEKNAVGFCLNNESIIATKSEESWNDLFQQRVRWAAKSTGYSSWFGKLTALLVFSTNVTWIAVFVMWLLGSLNQNWFALFVALKFIIDLFLLQKTASFFRIKLQWLFLASLLYPFFSSAVACYSLFGKFTWKGRNFRK
ncbi:glycosyltransferase family 2 protein [Flavobacterium haoranii]|uniref:Glycosyltransferase, catalytic subunit of cellulose synthase and poly-beta-1,6-N-acetylglucosamine synthase n=1 Tax=Flavobacterium haoranii TaxID=683124 RepID=A0A1M6FKK2_9FLAO|nr:glycosyltransferase [Flavobacterium haoranii]SHI98205.1 Glycosyltransferase, catalytic subunit of cellulose synthase and poly-beta-1,6-N-acetylglucosamine synthase [Flavobacterium haoranii]